MGTPSKERQKKDMVCMMTHNTIPNFSAIELCEHPGSDRRNKVYSIENTGTDNVRMLGEAVEPDPGSDYVLAVVDRTTGEVTFKPVSLYKFGAVYASDMDVKLGEKRRAPINYAEQHGIEKTEFLDRKTSLMDAFGDVKKRKMLEKMERRRIEENTMEALSKTAFASASVVEGATDKKDVKVADITAINSQSVSDVLPKPVESASLARDVYPPSLFVTDAEVEEYGELCMAHLQKKYADFESEDTTKENLFPTVYRHVLNGATKDPQYAVYYCTIGAMMYLLKVAGRGRLPQKAVIEAPFPRILTEAVREKYLKGEMAKKAGAGFSMTVNKVDIERLLAHALAFAMSIDPENRLYITLWSAYTRLAAPKIDKMALALGASKEALPQEMRLRYGTNVHVLRGAPVARKGPKIIRR